MECDEYARVKATAPEHSPRPEPAARVIAVTGGQGLDLCVVEADLLGEVGDVDAPLAVGTAQCRGAVDDQLAVSQ